MFRVLGLKGVSLKGKGRSQFKKKVTKGYTFHLVVSGLKVEAERCWH